MDTVGRAENTWHRWRNRASEQVPVVVVGQASSLDMVSGTRQYQGACGNINFGLRGCGQIVTRRQGFFSENLGGDG